jgi:hypothetical protein
VLAKQMSNIYFVFIAVSQFVAGIAPVLLERPEHNLSDTKSKKKKEWCQGQLTAPADVEEVKEIVPDTFSCITINCEARCV